MNEKIKKNYFLIISILLIAYFVINLLNGERGLFSYIKKKDDLNKLIDQELILKKKIWT